MSVSSGDLLRELRKFRQTLRSLELSEVTLSGGVWREIFTELLEHQNPFELTIRGCGYQAPTPAWMGPMTDNEDENSFGKEDQKVFEQCRKQLKATTESFRFPGDP
ncbi:hypothetical protein BDV59DRAFT_174021 [Aspergillus ambiguus]|uniref:uncharacterized protein n=1 Tax=Aspergillus ambiguus TaxID=176160 RepID=UPI003CCE52A7